MQSLKVDQMLPLPLERNTDGTKTVTLVQAPLLAGVSSIVPQNVKLPHVVQLSDTVDTVHTVPYSEMYGTHPRSIAAASEGFRTAPAHCDPYTPKSGLAMQARCAMAYR